MKTNGGVVEEVDNQPMKDPKIPVFGKSNPLS